jgi:hypothetical protein
MGCIPTVEEQNTMSQSTNMQDQSAAPNQAKVASLAYALWVERGCPEGSPDVDWLEAEEELREIEHQCSGGDLAMRAESSALKH